MYNIKYNDSEKGTTIYSKASIIILFIVGFLNGKPYFEMMGYSTFPQILLLIIYCIIPLIVLLTVMNILFKRKNYVLSSRYWIILAFAILIKYLLLFIQFPGSFAPGNVNFYPMLTSLISIFLIFILVENIKDLRTLRLSIWALGTGSFIATILPIAVFPEYIGLRINDINGFKISGGFWNQSVISYMSAGWLLMFLVIYEKKKIYRYIAFIMFVTLMISGIFGLSRAIFVSIVLSMFVYLVVSNNFKKYIKSIIIIIVVAGVVSFLFKDVINSFSSRIDGGIKIEEEARVDIWMDYLTNIPDYFMLGEIEGNYKKYSSSIKKFGPHSVVLNWFVQFGVIALIGFLYLMYGILKSFKSVYSHQSKELGAVVVAWFVAYISIAFINETGFDQFSIFSGIGIVLAWGNIAENSKVKIK